VSAPVAFSDTIAAVATAAGVGGIGIIRISGPEAKTISESLFSATLKTPRLLVFGTFYDANRNPIDEGCAVYFKGPASYTGEDVIEYHTHGSPVILNALLTAIFQKGARPADPGEFTRHAFLNGKLDLTQAEAVAEMVHANSDKSRQAAFQHLEGRLYKKLTSYRLTIKTILEQIEGSVDFPDEVPGIDRQETEKIWNTLYQDIQKIIQLKDFGKQVTQGIKCLIVGQPNAGKSSLLNALSGEDRAIVSPVSGTTRDYIEIPVQIGGFRFEFTDTAGIRKTAHKVEAIGISKIKNLLQKSQVVLWTLDQSQPYADEDEAIWKRIKKKKLLIVLNKSDLKSKKLKLPEEIVKTATILHISAKKEQGIDTLKSNLLEQVTADFPDQNLDLVCNARQLSCFMDIHQTLIRLRQTMKAGFPDDILAIDLKLILQKIGELSGDDVTEELLDGIFSRFCVGK